ncbi:hypothetical protein AXG93_1921s1120 [Marchantia polymorpha subsp. ruderalis]|uniref:Sulfurtransferase n=1 Tax=Marchantia polymorpha subsp. ruderalis TaxID=1480154 RepID=A0A176WN52_MARPO|nr:hypothetical protein AXG93_1921s1120 [Marchantia polymorpha subsp. ruderalis]
MAAVASFVSPSAIAPLRRSCAIASRRFFCSPSSASRASRTQFRGLTRTAEQRSLKSAEVAASVVAASRSQAFYWAIPARKMSEVAASAVGQSTGGPDSSEHLKSPVVSVDWLHQHLKDPNVKECHIPSALFFDVDGVVDPISELPHMLPTEAAFAAAASALGLSNEDNLIVYDGKGLFSAARVWWMFRAFGHENVWVLDGGFPKWRAKNYPVESTVSPDVLQKIESASGSVKKIYTQEKVEPSTFKAELQPHLVWSRDQVLNNIGDKKFQLVDARSKGRFDGTAPEPRKGIRGGHIPGSTCVPFPEVLSSEGTLLDASELAGKFRGSGVSLDSPIVASCGTGVTACILALALHRLGKKDVAVYDGSWTEWGMDPNTPVATNIPANH